MNDSTLRPDTPQRTVLLNPGPVTLTETVRQSMLGRVMCHREESFSELMQSVRRDLFVDDLSRCRAIEPVTAGLHATVVERGQWQSAVEA